MAMSKTALSYHRISGESSKIMAVLKYSVIPIRIRYLTFFSAIAFFNFSPSGVNPDDEMP